MTDKELKICVRIGPDRKLYTSSAITGSPDALETGKMLGVAADAIQKLVGELLPRMTQGNAEAFIAAFTIDWNSRAVEHTCAVSVKPQDDEP